LLRCDFIGNIEIVLITFSALFTFSIIRLFPILLATYAVNRITFLSALFEADLAKSLMLKSRLSRCKKNDATFINPKLPKISWWHQGLLHIHSLCHTLQGVCIFIHKVHPCCLKRPAVFKSMNRRTDNFVDFKGVIQFFPMAFVYDLKLVLWARSIEPWLKSVFAVTSPLAKIPQLRMLHHNPRLRSDFSPSMFTFSSFYSWRQQLNPLIYPNLRWLPCSYF
jgi:hypothetical protein